MRIVVLDAFTANPGDLSWSGLEDLGSVELHDRTARSELVDRAYGARAVLTNKVVLDAEAFDALPSVEYVGILATGTNVVDLAAARDRGVAVTNVPGYSTASVVQTTFGLLFELTHRIGHHAAEVRAGRWAACADFSFADFPLVELAGKQMGIVGYGAIGRGVGRVAEALGMRVAAASRPSLPSGVEAMEMDALFATSDVVSLHCPLTDENRGFVDARLLRSMKPTAFLLNTARGPLADEGALAAALDAGALAGAGLDVLSAEPPPAGHPLTGRQDCVVTPHIAWASKEARARLLDEAVANLAAWRGGEVRNRVV